MIGLAYFIQYGTDAPSNALMSSWWFYKASSDVDPVDVHHFLHDEIFPLVRAVQTSWIWYYGSELRDPFDYDAPDQSTITLDWPFIKGQDPGDGVPLQLATCIQRRAHPTNRKEWGRVFLPGVNITRIHNLTYQTVIDPITETADAGLVAIRDKMIEPLDFEGVTLTPCIRSLVQEDLLPLVSTHIVTRLCRCRQRDPVRFGDYPYIE